MDNMSNTFGFEKGMRIVDNLTKFNQKKKLLMTPKHPLYEKSKEYRMLYGAVVFMQAELNFLVNPLNNFEMQRLLSAGFKLQPENMAEVLRLSKDKGEVIDNLLEEFSTERERYLIMLDLANVSLQEGEIGRIMVSIFTVSPMFAMISEAGL